MSLNGCRFLRALLWAALLAFPISISATPIGVLSGLDVVEVTGPYTDGTYFSLDFTIDSLLSSYGEGYVSGASSFGYLNAVGASGWIVQDQPIPLIGDLAGDNNSMWFIDAAPDFTGLSVILNDTPYGSAPTPTLEWTAVTPTGGSREWGAADPDGEAEPAPGGGGAAPPAVPVIEGYLRGGVPDIEQLRNECGPTSTANSLLWLIKKYNLNTDELPKNPDGSVDEEALLTELADAMRPGWDETTAPADGDRGYPGLSPGQLETGAGNYIEENNLPLVVHGGHGDANATGAAAFGFVKSELQLGQDVQFLIDWDGPGAHWVTVVGYIDAGPDKKTLIVHDPVDGVTGNAYWTLKDDGTFTNMPGVASRAVAESVPEPSTYVMVITALALFALLRRRRLTRRVLDS